MRRLALAALAAVLAPTLPLHAQSPTASPQERALRHLSWRSIGPANMGGRTVDIAGVAGEPRVLYMATASGGLWRTTNQGTTWESIFDEGGTLSLGAVALAPSDANVVWLGTGENNPRNSSSVGDGVYRSTDGGDTWRHLGLAATEKIGRIRVHPRDPDVAWVAALGPTWGADEARGVFRTRDGGATWEKVLYVGPTTGASDLDIDPSNPRILFAGMYDHLRRPWHYRSGGPGSGLYRSKDGGDTWQELTGRANGLPGGTLGRIGVAVAPSDPDVVYAIIESDDGVLWRSTDGGETWELRSSDEAVGTRPFYYSDIRVDPTDANTVWAVSGGLLRSVDGGATWERLARNIHGDHQALWIDPMDPDRVVNGNDGGFHVSYDRGDTWEFLNTVALGQFYHVAVDDRWPYRACGGLQDNDVWCGPAETWTVAGGLRGDWYEIQGPGDGMYVQIDPRDPDVIWSTQQNGNVVKVDLETGETRAITPTPVTAGGAAANDPYRFNWNAPLHMSPHDPDVVFLGSNVVWRTDDGGQSWTALGGDLTKADTAKMGDSGGELTTENTGAETYGTVIALAQSPADPSVIWAGTDDGNLQVTRDGGATWRNVAGGLPGLGDTSWIAAVEPSRVSAGRAYVAVDDHRSDDMRPHVLVTEDFGASWRRLSDGLPPFGWVHVVREDPRNPDLLYAGTELGIFASWDRGGSWHDLRLGLPPVAVRDLVVHPRENDVVIATHGRSLWVLDDARPLQDLGPALEREAHVFAPGAAYIVRPWAKRFRFDIGDKVFVAENPPSGALLSYRMGPEAVAAVRRSAGTPADADDDTLTLALRITDAEGRTVRTVRGPAREGVNRTSWDLRSEGLPGPDGDALPRDAFRARMNGPFVLPGAYTVELVLPDGAGSAPAATVDVHLDPRHVVPLADLAAQRDALVRLRDVAARLAENVRAMDRVRSDLRSLAERAEAAATAPSRRGAPAPDSVSLAGVAADARVLADSVAALRAGIVEPEGGDRYGRARLLDQVRGLAGSVDRATARPTDAQVRGVAEVEERARAAMALWDELLGGPVAALSARAVRVGVPAVVP